MVFRGLDDLTCVWSYYLLPFLALFISFLSKWGRGGGSVRPYPNKRTSCTRFFFCVPLAITINLSCWLLSSALISNPLNVDKMCIQAQYHWFSHQNNKKQANKNIYNTSYLCGSFIQLVNHENFNLDKPSWAPPPPHPICQNLPMRTPWWDSLGFNYPTFYTTHWQADISHVSN